MRCLLPIVTLALTAPLFAQTRGINGHPAPRWGVTEWINLPDGKETLDIEDYRGRRAVPVLLPVMVPGLPQPRLPTLQKTIEHYDGVDDVAFVAVQTVFEGYASNTFATPKDMAAQFDLSIPVGQSGSDGRRSQLMNRYRTGGTPWTIIIDRKGIVRFNDFRITPRRAVERIDELVAEAGPAPGIPESRIGRRLIGQPLDLVTGSPG